MQELKMLRTVFKGITGLQDNQFFENAFGFPIVPIPIKQKRSSSSDSKNKDYSVIPPNVSKDFFGHPIYWMDTMLSAPTPEEKKDNTIYCVRMFYTMLALGVIDVETMEWTNIPRSQGIEYSVSAIVDYNNGLNSILDNVKILSEQDFVLGNFEDVIDATENTLKEIKKISLKQWRKFNTSLSIVTNNYENIAGEEAEKKLKKILSEIKKTLEIIKKKRISKTGSILEDGDNLNRLIDMLLLWVKDAHKSTEIFSQGIVSELNNSMQELSEISDIVNDVFVQENFHNKFEMKISDLIIRSTVSEEGLLGDEIYQQLLHECVNSVKVGLKSLRRAKRNYERTVIKKKRENT